MKNDNVLTRQDARPQLPSDINTIKYVPSVHVKLLSSLPLRNRPLDKQYAGPPLPYISSDPHPHSVSSKHRLLESRQWMCPSAQQRASCGLNQQSLLTTALPDLCPGALQSVQPRFWDWRPWGTGGLALLSEPLSTVTSPANNCGRVSSSATPPASPWDTPRTLPLNSLWSGQCETMTTTQEGRKKNWKITKAAQIGTELFNIYLGLPIFFWETKSTFALSKSTESSWLYYGCEPG